MGSTARESDRIRRILLFEDIRHDRRVEELSIRELADRYHVHRRTVREALASAVPPERKPYTPRERPVLGPWVATIDEWLIADRQVPVKQRHTSRRIWQRLVSEYGVQVGQRTVSGYVASRRVELGLDYREAFVPQDHFPGAEAEVDFGDIYAELCGVMTKFALFEMRLSASGRSVHRAFTTTGSEAFIEGHVVAFEEFGGVPGRIRYDNLKPAVTKVMRGRERIENDKFLLLRSHYGFDSFFCQPGRDGAHEKGGVEGGIGRFRRNHLVPVPKVSSLAELNELIIAADLADNDRVIAGRSQTVGAAFAEEQPKLSPLPVEGFDAMVSLNPKVDSHSRVCVRQSFYSVPVGLIGKRVHVRLGAATVEILDGGRVVARHERAIARGSQVLELDHYLEVLVKKPGALACATALSQAKAAGTFTASHQAYWDALREARGDQAGTRAFVEVLLAHRSLPVEALICAMELAVESGGLDPQAVIVSARHLNDRTVAPIVPIESVAKYDRPKPCLSQYDELIQGAS